MDLTNLHALLIDQKGGLSKRIDFASTRIQAARYTSLLPYGRIGVPNSPIPFKRIPCYACCVLVHLTPKGAWTMEWVTPQHEEIDLNCEVSSYANAEL